MLHVAAAFLDDIVLEWDLASENSSISSHPYAPTDERNHGFDALPGCWRRGRDHPLNLVRSRGAGAPNAWVECRAAEPRGRRAPYPPRHRAVPEEVHGAFQVAQAE